MRVLNEHEIFNKFHCQRLVKYITDSYMPYAPVWTGILLAKVKPLINRLSNSMIEDYFTFVKETMFPTNASYSFRFRTRRIRFASLQYDFRRHIFQRASAFKTKKKASTCRKKNDTKINNSYSSTLNTSDCCTDNKVVPNTFFSGRDYYVHYTEDIALYYWKVLK